MHPTTHLVNPLQEIMVYLIGKLNQNKVILTFGQFDHLIILDPLIWTRPTLLMVFFIDHNMIFLTSQIRQKFGQPKKIAQFVNIKI
jgi:hypothetical protein